MFKNLRFRNIPDLSSFRVSKKLNYTRPLPLPECPMGIEIEVERVRHRSPQVSSNGVYLFNAVEDGSLRNFGSEFVSLPLSGKTLIYGLEELERRFSLSPKLRGHEFSDRTSVHVHINSRDMTLDNLKSFLILYHISEDVLFNFAGRDRYNNHFCVPSHESDNIQNMLSFLDSCKSTSEPSYVLDNLNSGRSKYSSLNLLPMTTFGTIEFRHMEGTVDSHRLLTWCGAIQSLKKFACESSSSELLSRISVLNTSSEYSEILNDIFGEFYEDLTNNLNYSEIVDSLEDAVKTLKSSGVESKTITKMLTSQINSLTEPPKGKLGKVFENLGIKIKKRDKKDSIKSAGALSYEEFLSVLDNLEN